MSTILSGQPKTLGGGQRLQAELVRQLDKLNENKTKENEAQRFQIKIMIDRIDKEILCPSGVTDLQTVRKN